MSGQTRRDEVIIQVDYLHMRLDNLRQRLTAEVPLSDEQALATADALLTVETTLTGVFRSLDDVDDA